ncbi:hypothetical protein D3C72_1224080 [compost metagenome]
MDARHFPASVGGSRLWPIESCYEVKFIFGSRQPIVLSAFAWIACLDIDIQRSIFIIFQFIAVTDRKTIDWVFDEELIFVVHGDGPKAFDGWFLVFGEMNHIVVTAVESFTACINCRARIDGVGIKICTQT